MQVWRVDRIYVLGGGKAWISTQVDLDGSSNIWASPVVWHTATDDRGLTALLSRLGVNPAHVTAADSAANAVPSPAASVAPQVRTKGETTEGLAGPLWGIAGLAVGAVITVLASRRFPYARLTGRRGAIAEPERPDATELNSSPSDELSWPAQRR